MVVCLIFKHQQPSFSFPIYIDIDFYACRIYLIRYFLVIEKSLLCYLSHVYSCKVHKRNHLAVSMGELSGLHIAVQCTLKEPLVFACIDLYLSKLSHEGSVPAVIGPVGVKHLQLCYCRVSVLAPEVVSAMGEVINIHRKADLPLQLFKLFLIGCYESLNNRDSRLILLFLLP